VDSLLEQYDAYIAEATLKPSAGGRFEVSVDGSLVFSKLKSDRFPEDEELLKLVGQQIGAES
jgi:selenoprotein W-related protein